jgi:hypothetical protein
MKTAVRKLLRRLKRGIVANCAALRRYDDKRWLLRRYRDTYGKDLNLANPQTFTEKIFCRMIMLSQNENPLYTQLADKFAVRDYVKQKIGCEYLAKQLWSGVNPDEIPYDDLPQKFVIKANNGSGRTLIVEKGHDRQSISEKLRGWLCTNYYWAYHEFQYYKIRPRIVVEEFLDDGCTNGPLDYKIWCFNGQPELIQVNDHIHSFVSFYDLAWNKLQLGHRYPLAPSPDIPRPSNFDKMISIGACLSEKFDFVRIDLYNLRGIVKFGEFTFSPRAGIFEFEPSQWDPILGQKLIMTEEI